MEGEGAEQRKETGKGRSKNGERVVMDGRERRVLDKKEKMRRKYRGGRGKGKRKVYRKDMRTETKMAMGR